MNSPEEQVCPQQETLADESEVEMFTNLAIRYSVVDQLPWNRRAA